MTNRLEELLEKSETNKSGAEGLEKFPKII